MLLGKKVPVTINTTRNFQKELQALYERRHAIDSLIESLQAYDRYRETRSSMPQQRRSA